MQHLPNQPVYLTVLLPNDVSPQSTQPITHNTLIHNNLRSSMQSLHLLQLLQLLNTQDRSSSLNSAQSAVTTQSGPHAAVPALTCSCHLHQTLTPRRTASYSEQIIAHSVSHMLESSSLSQIWDSLSQSPWYCLALSLGCFTPVSHVHLD